MANDTLTTVFNLVGELSGEDTLTAGISVPDVMPESDPIFSTSPASEITSADITNWNNKSDFSGSYNDLTDKPAIPTIPTYISAFTNDIGYLTSYTETDPTVPSWAKQDEKPSYTVDEIGGKYNTSLGDDINEIYDDITNLGNSLSSKVDKVAGKGLSTNDYTTAEKEKLNGISAQANETTWTQIANTGTKIATISIDGTSTDVFAPEGGGGEENVLEGVQVNGTDLTITNKKVNVEMPVTDASTVWQGIYQTSAGQGMTLVGEIEYYSFETVSGDFTVPKLESNNELNYLILPKATTTHHGAMSASDKVKLDGISSGAEANVQSNWNETDASSDAYIQNKPTIPTVPTNVSAFTNDAGYITSAHEVPSGGTAGQVLAKNSGTDYDLVWTTVSGGGSVSDVQVDGTSVVSGGVASIDLTGKVNKSGDTMTGNLSFSNGNGTVFNYQSGNVSKEVSLKVTGAYSDGTGTYPVVGFTDITDNKRVILRNLRNPTSDSEAVTLGYFTANTFSGSYNDLRNKPSIPSKTSDLTNDSGFLTLATLPIYDGSVT